jgi:hypothetical protein
VVLFCLLESEAGTKKGKFGALVVNGRISHPQYRLRLLPATPLVVRRRYLVVVPKPLPAATLAVHRAYLIVVPRPLPRCTSQVLGRGTQADARDAEKVLDRGAQAAARGGAR